MKAIFFGSIGSVAETSELQRAAFNEAFIQHGLDWHWDRATYQRLLASSGGQSRIDAFAERKAMLVDAAKIHATKTRIFQQVLIDHGVPARPGVIETLRWAKAQGLHTGFVTTTERLTVNAIRASLPVGPATAFSIVTARREGLAEKPDPAAYLDALDHLGLAPWEALAVEDNHDGVSAARAAGLKVLAFPGENIHAADLSHACRVVRSDLFKDARALLAGRASTYARLPRPSRVAIPQNMPLHS